MRTQPKSVVSFASGAILLLSLIGQTSQAQSVIAGAAKPLNVPAGIPLGAKETATLPGDSVSAATISITYEVTQDTTPTDPTFGDYTYTYTINNTTASAYVLDLNIGFNASAPNAVLLGSIKGGTSAPENNGSAGITWFDTVLPKTSGATLSFESDDAPTYGKANAAGIPNNPAPWASTSTTTSEVAVPLVVPEPVTTVLMALSSLVLAFRPNMLKKA